MPARRPAAPSPPPAAPSRLRRILTLLAPPVAEIRREWRCLPLVLAAALLLRLAQPSTHWWPLAFVALVPWFWALRRLTPRAAFWVSWVYGFLSAFFVFIFLRYLHQFNPFIIPLGIPAMCLYLGVFSAIQGAGLVLMARRLPPWVALVGIVAWWVGWEWWRATGALGLPFALLGHAVAGSLTLAQSTAWFGVHGLSALAVVVNLVIMEVILGVRGRRIDAGLIGRAATALALLLACFIGGAAALSHWDDWEKDGVAVRIALLQPNIPQDLKHASYASEDPAVQRRLQDRITLNLFEMMDALKPGAFDLVVAPESAFTASFFDHATDLQREIRERVRTFDAPFVFGAVDNVFLTPDGGWTDDPDQALESAGYPHRYEAYNALFVFRPEDESHRHGADYHKIQLVPFGETVPYLDIIPGLQENIVQVGSFLAGDKRQPPIFVEVSTEPGNPVAERIPVRLGPSICFEDLFPHLHRRLARDGADLFINVTNNGWYDPSVGGIMHYEHARLRAIEMRRPMILSTNTGVTALITASGREASRLAVREKATLEGILYVDPEAPRTAYAFLGDVVGWAGFLFGWGLVIMLWRRREEAEADA